MSVTTTTTTYILPVFNTTRGPDGVRPVRALDAASAHSQAATMASFDTVARVIVKEETTYTRTDEDEPQDEVAAPRAFLTGKTPLRAA